MSVLSDSSTKVQETALQFYLPCLSVWLGDQFLSKLYFTLLSGVCSFIKTNNTRQCSTYIQTLTSCNVFLFTSLLRPILGVGQEQQIAKKGEAPPNSHLDLLNPCVILGVPISDFKNAVSALNTSLAQGPLSEQREWVKGTAVPLLVTALKDAHDNHALKGISGLLQHLLNITGNTLICVWRCIHLWHISIGFYWIYIRVHSTEYPLSLQVGHWYNTFLYRSATYPIPYQARSGDRGWPTGPEGSLHGYSGRVGGG